MIYLRELEVKTELRGSKVTIKQPGMAISKVKDIVDDGSIGFSFVGPGVDVFLEDGTKRHGDGENGGWGLYKLEPKDA